MKVAWRSGGERKDEKPEKVGRAREMGSLEPWLKEEDAV